MLDLLRNVGSALNFAGSESKMGTATGYLAKKYLVSKDDGLGATFLKGAMVRMLAGPEALEAFIIANPSEAAQQDLQNRNQDGVDRRY